MYKKKLFLIILVVSILFTTVLSINSSAAFSYTSAKSVLNSITLHPQKTGFVQLDNKVESLLTQFKKNSTSTYQTLLNAYDWLVYNVNYKSYKPEYPYYDFSSHYNCPVPYYVIYMAYNPLFCNEGVCDNFSSAFCVIARALGIDMYTCTGTQKTSSSSYTHVWCELYLNGETYVFDPQADNSVYARGKGNNHYYFCRPYSNLGSTSYSYGSYNTKMKNGFTSVNSTSVKNYSYVTYSVGGNGSVTTPQISQASAKSTANAQLWNKRNYSYQFSGWLYGTNVASNGSKIILTAKSNSGNSFKGWYINNKLMSTSTTYTFNVICDTLVEALFTGNRFNDVSSSSWYYDNVYFCFNQGLMAGTSVTKFSPNDNMTRAMMVTILAKMKSVNVSSYTTSSFTDVNINSWYGKYAEWAKQNGIVSGTSEKTFSPNSALTREQMYTMFYNFSKYCGYNISVTKSLSGFSDYSKISSWAVTPMEWAYARNFVSGTSSSLVSPKIIATRAQAATVVKRFRQA